VRPVAHRWFMPDSEVAALQAVGRAVPVPVAARGIGGGVGLSTVLAWTAIGLPLAWGVWITLAKVAVLFG